MSHTGVNGVASRRQAWRNGGGEPVSIAVRAYRRVLAQSRKGRYHRASSASRRTSWGWGPTVRGEQSGNPSRRTSWGLGPHRPRRAIRKSEPQDAVGAGAPPSEASDPEIRAAGRGRGWGPTVRGEQSGNPGGRTR